MNYRKFIGILIITLAVLFIGATCYLILTKKPSKTTSLPPQTEISTSTVQPETMVEYKNFQYSFSFSLPLSWKGYSIIIDSWKGSPVDNQTDQTIEGPEIIIRHPLWTLKSPRQDIPIMIFTNQQWNLVQQEKIFLGAAPIGPSELGRNANYIFALPARYNYAFPAGFEEVEKIIESKPVITF